MLFQTSATAPQLAKKCDLLRDPVAFELWSTPNEDSKWHEKLNNNPKGIIFSSQTINELAQRKGDQNGLPFKSVDGTEYYIEQGQIGRTVRRVMSADEIDNFIKSHKYVAMYKKTESCGHCAETVREIEGRIRNNTELAEKGFGYVITTSPGLDSRFIKEFFYDNGALISSKDYPGFSSTFKKSKGDLAHDAIREALGNLGIGADEKAMGMLFSFLNPPEKITPEFVKNRLEWVGIKNIDDEIVSRFFDFLTNPAGTSVETVKIIGDRLNEDRHDSRFIGLNWNKLNSDGKKFQRDRVIDECFILHPKTTAWKSGHEQVYISQEEGKKGAIKVTFMVEKSFLEKPADFIKLYERSKAGGNVSLDK